MLERMNQKAFDPRWMRFDFYHSGEPRRVSGAAEPSLGGAAVLDPAVGAAAEIVATTGKPRSNLVQIRAEVSGVHPVVNFTRNFLALREFNLKTNNEITQAAGLEHTKICLIFSGYHRETNMNKTSHCGPASTVLSHFSSFYLSGLLVLEELKAFLEGTHCSRYDSQHYFKLNSSDLDDRSFKSQSQPLKIQ